MNFSETWAKTVLMACNEMTDPVIRAMEILSDGGMDFGDIMDLYNGQVTVIEIGDI